MNKISVWCLAGGIALSSFCLQARATSNDDDLSFLSSFVDWSDWGQNINNTHFNFFGGIQKTDLNKIVKLCAIDYRANPTDPESTITSKPLIVNDVVYWSAQTGQIGAHKLVRDSKGNFKSCQKIWQQTVSNVANLGLQGLTTR